MNSRLFILTFLILSASISFSQKAQTPDYTYDLGKKIEYIRYTDLGVLVVSGRAGFAGIKAGEEKPRYIFEDYGKIKETDIEFVPMTPLVIIDERGLTKRGKTILNIANGDKVFATDDHGYTFITDLKVDFFEDRVVVQGQHSKRGNIIGFYTLSTGKELGFVKFKATHVITSAPFIVNNSVFVGTSKAALKLDLTTGEVVWEATKIKNVSSITVSDDGKDVYVEERKGVNSLVHKLDKSGNAVWKKPVKVAGVISKKAIKPEGLICVGDVSGKKGTNSQIHFLQASDGVDLWKKGPKIKGYINHFYLLDDGVLYGLSGGGINKVSFDGKPLFKKPFKTGAYIELMTSTPKGLLYISSTDCNIIDLNSGESVWNKNLKFKKLKLLVHNYDSERKRFLISTGYELLSLSEETGEVASLATYKFKEDEYPTSIIIRDNGILLTSDQTMLMLDFNGKEIYNVYYKAPGQSAGVKVLLATAMVASAAMSAGTAVSAQANRQVVYAGGGNYRLGGYTSVGQAKMDAANAFAGAAGALGAEMFKRFNATAATENAQFVLTMLDDGVGLVKIDKHDGKVLKEILLKDRKPIYEVDEIDGFLYYKANDQTIYAYDLNK